jgi:hypothetical protein
MAKMVVGEIRFQGEPPFHLPMTQSPEVRGDKDVVHVTLFASVAGKGPRDAPVRLGLSTNDANQLIADIQRAIVEAQKRNR